MCAVASPSISFAAALVFICSQPSGQRVDFGSVFDLEGTPLATIDQGARWEDNSFSNITPVVIWRETDPKVLLISWASTLPDELVGKVEPNADTLNAVVTFRDTNQVQAVALKCGTVSCTTFLYSLFPTLDFVTRADTSFALFPNDGAQATTRLFAAQCRSQ